MNSQRAWHRIGLAVCLFQGIACLGTVGQAAPWTGNARGPFAGGGGTVFYGIGVGNRIASPRKQASLAQNRARADLAATLKPKIQRLVRDYMARHRGCFGPRDFGGATEFSRAVSERFAVDLATGATVAAAWRDPATGLAYAVARVETSGAWFLRYQQELGAALMQRHVQDQSGQTQALLASLAADVASQRAGQASLFGPAKTEPPLLAQGI